MQLNEPWADMHKMKQAGQQRKKNGYKNDASIFCQS